MAQQSEVLKFVIDNLETRLRLLNQIIELLKLPIEPALSLQEFYLQCKGLTKYHYDLYIGKRNAVLAEGKFKQIAYELSKRRTELDRLHKLLSYELGQVDVTQFLHEIKDAPKELAYLQDVQRLVTNRNSNYEKFRKEGLEYEKMRIDNIKQKAADGVVTELMKMARQFNENLTAKTLPMPPRKNQPEGPVPSSTMQPPRSRPMNNY